MIPCFQWIPPSTQADPALNRIPHSTQGFIGECGLRGGYFELQGIPADVRSQIVKLASVSLCSNVVGQFTTGLMVDPPKEGHASYTTYSHERSQILRSLEVRAIRIADALNALPAISCNAAEGACISSRGEWRVVSSQVVMYL